MQTILVVEDDERSRRLLRDVLSFHGFNVVAFDRGEDALGWLREQIPDLLLLDIQLPGIDGFEVLRQIRADARADRLPVAAVTASVMEHDRKRIMDAGFTRYIGKPVNIRELPQTVAALIDGGAR